MQSDLWPEPADTGAFAFIGDRQVPQLLAHKEVIEFKVRLFGVHPAGQLFFRCAQAGNGLTVLRAERNGFPDTRTGAKNGLSQNRAETIPGLIHDGIPRVPQIVAVVTGRSGAGQKDKGREQAFHEGGSFGNATAQPILHCLGLQKGYVRNGFAFIVSAIGAPRRDRIVGASCS